MSIFFKSEIKNMHSIGVEEARSNPRTRSATTHAVESVKSGCACAAAAGSPIRVFCSCMAGTPSHVAAAPALSGAVAHMHGEETAESSPALLFERGSASGTDAFHVSNSATTTGRHEASTRRSGSVSRRVSPSSTRSSVLDGKPMEINSPPSSVLSERLVGLKGRICVQTAKADRS